MIVPGTYMPGDSGIHRLDPRTKLAGAFTLMLTVLIVNTWPGILINMLLLLVGIRFTALNLKIFFRGMKWLWLFLLISFLIQIFLIKGSVLFRIGPLTVSGQGVSRGMASGVRILIVYVTATALNMTTSPRSLAAGLQALFSPLNHLGIPVNRLAMLTTISLRFIPTIIEEADHIRRAQLSRGAPLNAAGLVRLKAQMALVIPLIAGSLQRAEDLALAMESRCCGSDCQNRSFKKLKFSHSDAIAFAVIAGSMILSLWSTLV